MTLTPHPSRRLRAALFLAHLAALGGIAVLASVWPLTALAIPVLLGSLWWNLKQVAVCRLVLQRDGALLWQEGERGEIPARVLGGSTVFGWLVVLRVAIDGDRRCRSLVLLGDSLPAADFRRLRVWLRWLAAA